MANLQPLPAPGLAICPQYLSSTPLRITLRGSTFSKSMTANLDDGKELFTIDGASFSMSHRRAVLDAASNSRLFEIRKDGMGLKYYYAEISENGPRMFELKTSSHFMHRPTTSVRFANQADASNGRPEAELEFTPAGMGKDGSFTWNGQLVAVVEKISMSLSGEYLLTIAPGLDPSLVVGVMVAAIDRAKTQSNSAAVSGGLAGSTAVGGGGA